MSLLERHLNRRPKNTGLRSERRTADRMGSRLTPASGAASAKGDSVLPETLLERKSTVKLSYSIKLRELLKIRKEALETNRCPALTVTFTDSEGRPRPGGTWVLIEESYLQDLLERVRP